MNLDNFIKECKENPVSLTLQKTCSLGNGSYKVLCETSKRNPKFAEVKKAVSKMFNNKVSVVEATVKNVSEQLISFIVKANVRSLAFKNGQLPAGKKMVTASIAADVNDNSIWEVQGTGDNKRLVLKASDDFEKIFEHNNRICTAAVKVSNVNVESGDYISYYDSKEAKVKAGYAIVSEDDSITVIDQDMNENEVAPEEVLDSADLTDLEKNPVEAAFSAGDKSKVLDYMSKLYKDTEFFSKLNELMGVRVKEGNDGKYTSTMVVASYEDNLDQIKEEIKEFLINDSIEELREEVLNTEIDEIDDSDGNSEGDIDFANDEEVESNMEEAPAKEDLVEVENEIEPTEEVEEMSEIEVSPNEAAEDLGDLVDEDDITVTTEAELDEGEFDNVEVEEVSDKDLSNKFEEIQNEE